MVGGPLRGWRAARTKIGIVAVARRLLIELWRYLEHGVIPDGAIVVASAASRTAYDGSATRTSLADEVLVRSAQSWGGRPGELREAGFHETVVKEGSPASDGCTRRPWAHSLVW